MISEMTETTKAILLELAQVDRGEIILPIARELYPEESLMAARDAFAAYCETEIDPASCGIPSILSIRVSTEHRRKSREIIGAFLSYLLHHAVQIRFRPEAGR